MRIGLAIVVATASAAAAPRPGRVVRVERAHRDTGTPRFCAMPNDGDVVGICFGAPPAIGEAIEIVDITHYIGRVRVAHVDAMGQCKGSANLWQVKTEPDGDLATDIDRRDVIGLIDVPLDPQRARLVEVQQPPQSAALMEKGVGVDADGDGRVDVELVIVQCDPSGHGQCFEVWRDPDGHSPQLLYRDTFAEGC